MLYGRGSVGPSELELTCGPVALVSVKEGWELGSALHCITNSRSSCYILTYIHDHCTYR
jgi:hypothetical protein